MSSETCIRNIDGTIRVIAADPDRGLLIASPWKQPQGAHDAYPKGSLVYHGDRMRWSTTDANVWEPGVSGWHDVPEDPNAVPQWVQPTGGHDAYSAGAEVMHNNKRWLNAHGDGNVWEPGVFGWTEVV